MAKPLPSILTILSMLVLRNLIEGWTNPALLDKIYGMSAQLHHILFFISILMSLWILIYLFTGRSALEMMARFSFIIPLVPLIDLIWTSGKGYQMTYALPKQNIDWLNAFITIGGDAPKGVSPGQKIEILLIVIALAVLVYHRRNALAGMIAGALSYCIIFIYGSLPVTLTLLGNLNDSMLNDQLFISFFFAAIVIQSGLIMFLVQRRTFGVLMRNSRPIRVIYYLTLVGLGIAYAGLEISLQKLIDVLNLGLAVFLSGIFNVAMNDIHDKDIDMVSNKDRPLPKKAISEKVFAIAGYVALAVSVLLALSINAASALMILAGCCLYYIYSSPPLRLKKVVILAKFLVGTVSLCAFMLGFAAMDGSFSGFPFGQALQITFLVSLSANLIDLKDIEGDKKGGITTLPTMLGRKAASVLIGVFCLAACLLIPFIMGFPWLAWISVPAALLVSLIMYKGWNEKYIFYIIILTLIVFAMILMTKN